MPTEGAPRSLAALHRLLAVRSDTVEQELRSVAMQAANGRAWLEKIEFRTRPPLDLDRIAERDDPVGLLVRELRRFGEDTALLRAVTGEALGDDEGCVPTIPLKVDGGRILLLREAVVPTEPAPAWRGPAL